MSNYNYHRFSHLNLINANSTNDNDILNSSNEIDSENNENELNEDDIKSYEYLLELTEYVYNGKDKTNKYNKLRSNIFHTSSNDLATLGGPSLSVNDKKENNIQNIKKDCKYISYYWYMNAKKEKSFGNN